MSAPGYDRVRVKICGITNREDAEAAIRAGADALGFNLFPDSKRFIELDDEARWIATLPPFVAKVGVLVNASLDVARAVALHPAIDLVQFHGDEDARYCAEFARLGKPFIKALRLGADADLDEATNYSTSTVLLDTHVQGEYGGTGEAIDLNLASPFARKYPALTWILAGGLTPGNVAYAVRALRPYAVDVASGVEVAARKKGEELMRRFVAQARNA
jgi:phosphoribosylanthranilate isomerase